MSRDAEGLIIERFFDIGGAVAGLILSAPLLALTALLVFLCDRAPVIFRYRRIGRDGRPFVILKFRTMRKGGRSQH